MTCPVCGSAVEPSRSFCGRRCAAISREARRVRIKVVLWRPCNCGCGRWFAPKRKGNRPHHGFIVGHNSAARRAQCRRCGARVRRLGNIYCGRSCASDARRNESRRERTGARYRRWRAAVLERDGRICQDCGRSGSHAHHLVSWAESSELRFDVENGVTLCPPCHAERHGGRGFTARWAAEKVLDAGV